MAGWFLAVIVRGSHLEGVLDENQLGDLIYRLVEAPDAETAYQKAVALGQKATDSYSDDDGKSYTLQFLGLADLTEIGASRLEDGVEVYSQILPSKPSEMVVEKGELTVFEPDEELEASSFEDDAITPR
jgi:hypothetical protein